VERKNLQRRRALKKYMGQEVAIFCQALQISNRILRNSCKLSKEEIMGAQNFNVTPEFSQSGGFQLKIMVVNYHLPPPFHNANRHTTKL